MKQKFSHATIGAAIMFVVFFAAGQLNNAGEPAPAKSIAYSELLTEIQARNVKEVTIEGEKIVAVTASGAILKSTVTLLDRGLINDLISNDVKFDVKNPEGPSVLGQLFISWFPMLLMLGVWIFFMRKSQGKNGVGGIMAIGKSKARMLDDNSNRVTFADVAGCDEAKEEVSEIVEFLGNPDKFTQLGGRVPHGVLMVGPPGTGKTLLARAIAGEAKVPFFTISGSDFVEMFVGVGASRVRDMFKEAKEHAPCIIFIDEIDAVGRRRGSGMGGGNDEREQTLNQLLVEMDGFEGNSGVIVVAATNRADVLDKALLRPGRFDRQVSVGLPDIRGREQILHVHMRRVPLSKDVHANVLARGTPGFSGADLANLVNEAALFAARRSKEFVEMNDFEDAKDKIVMGPERKSAVMREEERRNTAYHESGHAVIAALLPHADPVHKVTIMPRGFALGLTWQLPEHDRVTMYKDKMLEDIAILFGGRIAEEMFMHQQSTGASNDFERATNMARAMVTRYGMSEALGIMVYADSQEESGLGMTAPSVSEETQQKVDDEIRRILDRQYSLAHSLLKANHDKVEAMTKALLAWETVDADQVRDIMSSTEPRPPKHDASGKSMHKPGLVAPHTPAQA